MNVPAATLGWHCWVTLWLAWPGPADYGRVNNINALVRALWPSLSNAIEQQLVLQLVPALLSDAAKAYGAGYVKGLELSQFSLGPVRRSDDST
jgi:hypothetical protein